MLLAIDIGNTNIKLGLWTGKKWQHVWRVSTVPDKLTDDYAVLLQNLLRTTAFNFQFVQGAVISSVVPALTGTFSELVEQHVKVEPLIVTNQLHLGIEIEVDHPEQVGTDRLVNAAAAFALYGSPALVVDFGTATKFDVVSPGGVYRGGAISPGIAVTHEALVNHAAQLQPVEIEPPPNPIARNTTHAMQSGMFWGYVGLVEQLIKRIKATMPRQHVPVIATGGYAARIQKHLPILDVIAPNLTLDGLRLIYEKNSNL